MRPSLRFLLVVVVAALAASSRPGDTTAQANARRCEGASGAAGYAYAGHQASTVAHGIRATITLDTTPDVQAGHVAGWVGVGGPRQGANGETAWLQAGIASFADAPAMLYAEITRAGQAPELVPLADGVRAGESHRVAVLELPARPSWWRVWVDGRPATPPVLLRGSTGRWKPIATAESWNGGRAICNAFAFRFDGVRVATAVGGAWTPFTPGYTFEDPGFSISRLSLTPGTVRALAGRVTTPYAFDARSL